MNRGAGSLAGRALPVLLACAAGAAALPVAAWAQTPPPAQAAPVDPAFAAAQRAFDALPEPDRKAIQENLIWTGDFSGAGTGGFGPLTYKAILAFQARQKAKADGILQPLDLAALQVQAARARDALRFARVIDGRTGIRIGVPQKLLDKPRAGATGTVFAGADPGLLLETYQARQDLPSLFDSLKADGPNRRITYKVIRPDWFVVSGDAGPQRFYTRFAFTPAGLRGYTFSYPLARAAEFDRLSIAIANTFEAVPVATPAAPPGPVAGVPTPAPGAPAAAKPPAPAPALLLTGLVVAPGKVLTAATIEGCAAPLVARQPATVARVDKAAGLALLEAPAARAAVSLPAGTAAPDGAELVVVGYSAAGADTSLSVAPGEARVPAGGALRVFAPLQRGAAGSAVFDRSGGFLGVVGPASAEPRLVAGIVPQASWPVIPARAVTELGGTLGAAPSGAKTAGAIAAAARPALVAVECGR